VELTLASLVNESLARWRPSAATTTARAPDQRRRIAGNAGCSGSNCPSAIGLNPALPSNILEPLADDLVRDLRSRCGYVAITGVRGIMKKYLKDFIADESGATAIEYGLIAAGISLAIIAVVNGLGTKLNTKFTAINNSLK
jgi:pilus assembly protein Flp/PilA